MLPLLSCTAALIAAASALTVPSTQIPIVDVLPFPVGPTKRRKLHGRFLHITDIHPHAFYTLYSSTAQDAACHRGPGPAGLYGAETSKCDSPFALVNQTFKWIEKEFRDNVDFIVWTGYSARHDNDEHFPRNLAQVAGLNEMLVHKMYESFGKRNVDWEDEDPNNDYVILIIPTLDNNDVLPHNIMQRGPNQRSRAYIRISRQFIPEPQTHSFEQGG
ncbi:Endopolyphosphatase [Oleoguttula sp. CCFEE 5521]